jgi:UDP-N-acetylmuramoylalanine--D-glutamate ligase
MVPDTLPRGTSRRPAAAAGRELLICAAAMQPSEPPPALPTYPSATVVGLGLFGGGVGVARWLARQGSRVTVTDLRDESVLAAALAQLAGLGVRFVLGRHEEADFVRTDLVVANPAVPPNSSYLAAARRAGVRVGSEVELFLERAHGRLVAITGTQGKSSSASFLAQLLERACDPGGGRTHLGGNIGGSLLEELDSIAAGDRVVIELSSYQLEALPAVPRARLELAAITNVLADHLERHGTLEAYKRAKLRLLELVRPDGLVLLPPDLAATVNAPGKRVVVVGAGTPRKGLVLHEGAFLLDGECLGRVADLPFAEEFQHRNALLALGAARLLGARAEALAAALPHLRGLPHRLEDLGLRGGRRVIDNGVSTTPDSTLSALAAVSSPCTLLIDGRAKRGLSFEELGREIARRGDAAVVFGADRESVAGALVSTGARVLRASDLKRAVAAAFESEPRDATLLFSPACASFDAYANFRARALAFRAHLPAGDPATKAPSR